MMQGEVMPQSALEMLMDELDAAPEEVVSEYGAYEIDPKFVVASGPREWVVVERNYRMLRL